MDFPEARNAQGLLDPGIRTSIAEAIDNQDSGSVMEVTDLTRRIAVRHSCPETMYEPIRMLLCELGVRRGLTLKI